MQYTYFCETGSFNCETMVISGTNKLLFIWVSSNNTIASASQPQSRERNYSKLRHCCRDLFGCILLSCQIKHRSNTLPQLTTALLLSIGCFACEKQDNWRYSCDIPPRCVLPAVT